MPRRAASAMRAAHRGVRSRIAEHLRTNGRDDGDRAKPHLGGMKEERTPDIWTCLWRGWRGRCPRCAAGSLFSSFLKMRSHCRPAKLALEPYRADDAPGTSRFLQSATSSCAVLMVERYGGTRPVVMRHWASALVVLALALLPRIKGAVIALLGASDSRSQAFQRELRPQPENVAARRRPVLCCAVAGYGSVADPFST